MKQNVSVKSGDIFICVFVIIMYQLRFVVVLLTTGTDTEPMPDRNLQPEERLIKKAFHC